MDALIAEKICNRAGGAALTSLGCVSRLFSSFVAAERSSRGISAGLEAPPAPEDHTQMSRLVTQLERACLDIGMERDILGRLEALLGRQATRFANRSVTDALSCEMNDPDEQRLLKKYFVGVAFDELISLSYSLRVLCPYWSFGGNCQLVRNIGCGNWPQPVLLMRDDTGSILKVPVKDFEPSNDEDEPIPPPYSLRLIKVLYTVLTRPRNGGSNADSDWKLFRSAVAKILYGPHCLGYDAEFEVTSWVNDLVEFEKLTWVNDEALSEIVEEVKQSGMNNTTVRNQDGRPSDVQRLQDDEQRNMDDVGVDQNGSNDTFVDEHSLVPNAMEAFQDQGSRAHDVQEAQVDTQGLQDSFEDVDEGKHEAIQESLTEATERANDEFMRAVLASKADIHATGLPLNADGIVVLRLTARAQAPEVRNALLSASSLESARSTVLDAGCTLETANGARKFVPLTPEQLDEAGIELQGHHIVTLASDVVNIRNALRDIKWKTRPKLKGAEADSLHRKRRRGDDGQPIEGQEPWVSSEPSTTFHPEAEVPVDVDEDEDAPTCVEAVAEYSFELRTDSDVGLPVYAHPSQ